MKVAIVWSRFNESITRSLLKGAERGLREAGLADGSIRALEVPGAFEIPVAALRAAETKTFDAVICLGAVIRGETPHFDYVCQGATQGVMQAQLQTGVPMAFGVLTTDTIDQALRRAGDDDENKGYEAAKVVIEMVELVRGLGKKKK